MRIGTRILISVFLVFLIFSCLAYLFLSSTLPRSKGVIKIDKIQGKVEIERNKWGVPFIRAENMEDLFFAIGFVHAQDRLFQMDLTRRLSMGRLSEIFGSATLDSDISQKTILNEESIDKSLEKVNPKIKELMNHYSEGINYFIENESLPLEFRILNYKPERWSPRDSLFVFKMMEGILCESGSELSNFRIVKALGLERAKKLIYGNYSTSIIKDEDLKRINRNLTISGFSTLRNEEIGSNNWVISGKITASGFPFLSNDPHLGVRFPSYFYQIYANTEGVELSGNTIPGTPFIVIGRNRNIGWGFTNIGTDVIDYFILTLNPENQNQYLWEGKWKDFKVISKKIKIKGGAEISKEVKLTEFGRVEEIDGIYFGIQSVIDLPTTTISAFFEMNFSKNYEEFLSALKKFSSPAQNVVFADREGNIGYFPSGLIPMRGKGDGSLPVFANGERDIWQGFWNEDDKPYILNPERGYIVTANNPVLPEDKLPIFSKGWGPYFRADRIEEMIQEFLIEKARLGIEDMITIQTDTFHKGAEFLIKKIKNIKFDSEKANFVLDHLRNWDFKIDKGFAPYLFYTFENFLARNIFEDHCKSESERDLISMSWIYRILNYPLGNEDEEIYFWMDDLRTEKREDFKEMMERSLENTYDKFKEEFKERKFINWEEIHKIEYSHPLSRNPLLKFFLNRGPYYMQGGRNTVLSAGFARAKSFNVSACSAFRMIIDFSDFSSSFLINSSGQSGNFLSKYYDDQISFFVSNKYRKMEELPQGKNFLVLIRCD